MGLKGFRLDIESLKSVRMLSRNEAKLKLNDAKVISIHPAFVRALAAQKVGA